MPKQSTTTRYLRTCHRCGQPVLKDGDPDTVFDGEAWIVGLWPRCGACVRQDPSFNKAIPPTPTKPRPVSRKTVVPPTAYRPMKPVDETNRETVYATGATCRCSSCKNVRAREYNRVRTVRGREAIRALKSKPCTDCGGSFPDYVMQFDHRDPSTKLKSIGNLTSAGLTPKVLAEIAKCDLVCANCHAVRTHKQRLAKAWSQTGRPRSKPLDPECRAQAWERSARLIGESAHE